MTPLAYLALFGWPLLVVILFAIRPAQQAAAIAVVGAWLLLPPYSFVINGLPDYTKSVAATLGVVLGTLLFAPDRLLSFVPRWFDLPMLGWCFCGIPSALSNGPEMGLYDGLSDALSQIVIWGLPYLIGRLYLNTLEDLRHFTVAMAVGGLSYVLPCLWEVRMSPQLLGQIYGIGGWSGMRLGGYRPQVFFSTGLECGMWMTAASLTAWWLWRCGALKQLRGYAFGPMLVVLLVTTVLCRSTGALALFVMGVALLWLSIRYRTRLILAGLLLVFPFYIAIRLPDLWSGQQAVDLATAVVGPVRSESLEYRFKCERLLGDRALERPVFGWGGYGRNLVYWDEEHRKPVPPDGMWIGTLGGKGFVGMTLLYLSLVLPAARFVRNFPVRRWGDPGVAAASLAAGFMGLYLVDCLLNAFVNIIYISMAGGLASLDPRQLRTPGRDAEATGRRAVGRTAPWAPHVVATAASGRALLADRCRSLGRSFKLEGRLDEADAAWRQALDLLAALAAADPGNAEPRRRWCDCANDIAWLRANHPDPARRDPATAVSLARRAVDECPDVAAYWNTLGAASYRAGDDRAAIDALEHARALAGGTAFDDVFLAMARSRAGDAEGARQALALAMLQAERDHPGHPELAALCDEAHSLIAGGAPAPAIVG